MYQNIYIEKPKQGKPIVHIWDDVKGHLKIKYKPYAYAKNPSGALGDKLSIDDPLLKQIHYSAKDKITLYSSSKKDFVQAGSVERKPDMECSICISKITKKQKSDWCKWSCGMNFHETCITRWLRIQQTQKSDLTCPMCRQLWNEHK